MMTPDSSDGDPWDPIVLSLDGGGVKGLSSLYILREIMRQIKRLDEVDVEDNRLEPNSDQQLPLPCHYFDFMIGTSTGGLIAIMLGRLRMGVNECIQQYLIFSNAIFRPPRRRLIQHYSRRKLQEAAKTVVKKFCPNHQNNRADCNGDEYLRQNDYDEQGDAASDPKYANRTCRVAVMTVREGGENNFRSDTSDVAILFRSYNHRRRRIGAKSEMNPRTLEDAKLRIHEACGATTAAPTYFRPVVIKGRKYIDGGVHANNPAIYAWNEAMQMSNPPGRPGNKKPYALVSIGTGMSQKHNRIKLRSLISFAAKKIVDTEEAHLQAESLIHQLERTYFRFNIPAQPRLYPEHKGLAKINMTSCDKTRKKSYIKPSRPDPGASTGTATISGQRTLEQLAAHDDRRLQEIAAETHKGGFKPQKYKYITFEKIRDRTIAYCGSELRDGTLVMSKIDDCARMLRGQSLKRRNLERNSPNGAPAVRSLVQFRNPGF
ncbi:acyl transferase/acyl hydrolase/lysophospholipase [Xylaria curta]|nr:acyl transferase/acyl hydrolase/lysophospholipase [Xylaria curta]